MEISIKILYYLKAKILVQITKNLNVLYILSKHSTLHKISIFYCLRTGVSKILSNLPKIDIFGE